ncbi:MAG TPA: MauE/DoxX family redox-associated membrane protein [Anaeromyxobacteraceae bacterium]|nr:MauE/DoxX family redox-associated membrane protein [Anaeromyxobacteraceae bacterium]
MRARAALRMALGAVFAWAALSKLPDMAAFAELVANYRLLPPAAVPVFAAVLVGVEAVVGVALLAGLGARAAAGLAAALLLAFTVALAQALVRGIDLACGCFGGGDSASWWTVARDLALFAAALASAALGPGRLGPRPAAPAAG